MVRAPAPLDVGLERMARSMEAKAQQLDRDAERGQMAVDLVAAKIDIRARSRQPVLAEEIEEAVLGHAERDVRAHRSPQAVDAGLARDALDAGFDLRRRRPV